MNTKTQFTWTLISLVGLLAILTLVFSVESSGANFADVLGFNSQFQTSTKISKKGLEKVKVKSVVDGDTIHLTDGCRNQSRGIYLFNKLYKRKSCAVSI